MRLTNLKNTSSSVSFKLPIFVEIGTFYVRFSGIFSIKKQGSFIGADDEYVRTSKAQRSR